MPPGGGRGALRSASLSVSIAGASWSACPVPGSIRASFMSAGGAPVVVGRASGPRRRRRSRAASVPGRSFVAWPSSVAVGAVVVVVLRPSSTPTRRLAPRCGPRRGSRSRRSVTPCSQVTPTVRVAVDRLRRGPTGRLRRRRSGGRRCRGRCFAGVRRAVLGVVLLGDHDRDLADLGRHGRGVHVTAFAGAALGHGRRGAERVAAARIWPEAVPSGARGRDRAAGTMSSVFTPAAVTSDGEDGSRDQGLLAQSDVAGTTESH